MRMSKTMQEALDRFDDAMKELEEILKLNNAEENPDPLYMLGLDPSGIPSPGHQTKERKTLQ